MPPENRLDELTAREREVLDLVRLGLTNEEIAGRLGITEAGAKYHVSQILSKLGVATREEAAGVVLGARRRWWAALPLAAKAAGVAIMLAAVLGLGVLAWGVLRTRDGGTEASDGGHIDASAQQPGELTIEEATNFSEFPLYWLGESYGDLPLNEILRSKYDPPDDPVLQLSRSNSIDFVYGDCVPEPNLFDHSGCNVPLWIKIEPNCARSSEFTPERFPIGEPTTVVGLPARSQDEGHIVVWVGSVTVTIGSPRPDRVRAIDVANALKPLTAFAPPLNDAPTNPDLSGCVAD